jgi:hypothetical protein
VSFFPAQKTNLDTQLNASLFLVPDGPEKANGKAVGSAAAADIVALRANDGASPNVTYAGPATPGPGQWRPTPGATAGTFPPGINQQWGTVKPFLLPSASLYRPGPPPALDSTNYLQALAEVQAIGAATNQVRTADQKHIAQFYKQDAELQVNEAARQLALAHGLSLEENALLFALVDIAVADARIAVWDAKYTYLFWRPITALNANADGSVTNNYATWTPLIVTPAHPSYPSGHSGTVNAGIEVLKDYFGSRSTLSSTTTTAGEPDRLTKSLNDIERENGLSRIYGGIHFKFDNVEGQAIGNKVAAYTLANGPHIITSSSTNQSQVSISLYPGIAVQGNVGHSYRVEYATKVNPTNWVGLSSLTVPSSSPQLVFDREATGTRTNRFYRVVEVSNGD